MIVYNHCQPKVFINDCPNTMNPERINDNIRHWILPVLIKRLDTSWSLYFCVTITVTRGSITLAIEVENCMYICCKRIATEKIATDMVPDIAPKTNCPVPPVYSIHYGINKYPERVDCYLFNE